LHGVLTVFCGDSFKGGRKDSIRVAKPGPRIPAISEPEEIKYPRPKLKKILKGGLTKVVSGEPFIGDLYEPRICHPSMNSGQVLLKETSGEEGGAAGPALSRDKS